MKLQYVTKEFPTGGKPPPADRPIPVDASRIWPKLFTVVALVAPATPTPFALIMPVLRLTRQHGRSRPTSAELESACEQTAGGSLGERTGHQLGKLGKLLHSNGESELGRELDRVDPGNNDPWPEVRDMLNRSLFGWSNYFCHGTRRSAFRGVDRYVYERVRDFLARRHKVAGRGTRRFIRRRPA